LILTPVLFYAFFKELKCYENQLFITLTSEADLVDG